MIPLHPTVNALLDRKGLPRRLVQACRARQAAAASESRARAIRDGGRHIIITSRVRRRGARFRAVCADLDIIVEADAVDAVDDRREGDIRRCYEGLIPLSLRARSNALLRPTPVRLRAMLVLLDLLSTSRRKTTACHMRIRLPTEMMAALRVAKSPGLRSVPQS